MMTTFSTTIGMVLGLYIGGVAIYKSWPYDCSGLINFIGLECNNMDVVYIYNLLTSYVQVYI